MSPHPRGDGLIAAIADRDVLAAPEARDAKAEPDVDQRRSARDGEGDRQGGHGFYLRRSATSLHGPGGACNSGENRYRRHGSKRASGRQASRPSWPFSRPLLARIMNSKRMEQVPGWLSPREK